LKFGGNCQDNVSTHLTEIYNIDTIICAIFNAEKIHIVALRSHGSEKVTPEPLNSIQKCLKDPISSSKNRKDCQCSSSNPIRERALRHLNCILQFLEYPTGYLRHL